MTTHYVIFDGTTNYVTDKQDALSKVAKCINTKVVFKSNNFDLCCDKADELNEDL